MHVRALLPLAIVALLAPAAPASAQQVELSLAGGRATLRATNATPAAILAEWARLGGTRVVDAERLTGTPLTLTLENVSEREALDIVLRSAAGYIAAARPAGTNGVSAFDRIIVMPVSANAATARSGPAPAAASAAAMPMLPQQTEPMMMQADGQNGDAGVTDWNADGVEQPVSSTEFDYANPQRYFAQRAAQQRAAAEAAAAQDGTATGDAGTAEATPAPGGLSMGTLLSAPGTIPTPPEPQPGPGLTGSPAQPRLNPYGLPADAAPGSAPGNATAPPMEPDRSKYFNPYAPTPRPPSQ